MAKDKQKKQSRKLTDEELKQVTGGGTLSECRNLSGQELAKCITNSMYSDNRPPYSYSGETVNVN